MKTLLLGDVSPKAKHVIDLFDKKDVKALFSDAISLFKDNDINFINLECAITDSENEIKKFGPCLKTCRNTADVLKEIGVTVCGLSNNHIFDFGIKGATDTIKALDETGLDYTGFGDNYEDSRRNYVVTKNGEKVCLIAVCEHEYSYAIEDRMGSRPFDEFETMDDIREAKKNCDRVIVLYHGGKELCQYPSPRLVKACRAMIKNGADVVLCQHTHCIGCYENFEGGHILYGQGNFHFIYPEYASNILWNECLAVKYDTKTNEIEFTPIVANDNGIELAKGEKKEQILRDFEARCKTIADGTWIKGWREFCDSVKDIYERAAKGACDVEFDKIGDSIFAHYLDCEAHTDVWKELFKTANHRNEK